VQSGGVAAAALSFFLTSLDQSSYRRSQIVAGPLLRPEGDMTEAAASLASPAASSLGRLPHIYIYTHINQ
jgi:hypothetical protein